MNAAVKSKTKSYELLIAANHQLESVFLKKPEPCVALLISRNYNLLLQEQAQLTIRFNFMQKAKYWWQEYLKMSTAKRSKVMFDINHNELLFKRIDQKSLQSSFYSI
tara:strand:+ start:2215 stop:2535 length:321 start_codon:yes stop_codon:yes gene_type:complete